MTVIHTPLLKYITLKDAVRAKVQNEKGEWIVKFKSLPAGAATYVPHASHILFIHQHFNNL
jgi:hypothetical protein